METINYIVDCIVNNAIVTVLEKHGETSLVSYQEAVDNLSALEEYAEYQCEDFNEDYSYDPELVFIWNPYEAFLLECGLCWPK